MATGRVSVNGSTVREPGSRVDPELDEVSVDGVRLRSRRVRWIALHKPAGVDVTRRDVHAKRIVYELVPKELGHLRYVGRLDRESEGLLVMTNDGATAHAVQHPSGGVEREYDVFVSGSRVLHLVGQLARGVRLEDGPAAPVAIAASLGPRGSARVKLVLAEGRKREVRRMMSAVGLEVERLVRVRFGPVRLGDLGAGEWRDLTTSEVAALAAEARVRTAGTKERGR